MQRTGSLLLLTTLVASIGVASPRDVGAQGNRRIVVTPYAGAFVPANKVAEFESQNGPGQTRGIRQQSALALGVTASYWFNNLAGFEVGGAFAFSNARASAGLSNEVPGLSLSGTESARVIVGSAKLMVNLLPITQRSALRLGVGPAIISHGGNAYTGDADGTFAGLTDLGGVVSLCSRVPVTDFMSLRLRAENYMYSAKLRFRDPMNPDGEFSFGSMLQNDFIFSAGLQMVFWR